MKCKPLSKKLAVSYPKECKERRLPEKRRRGDFHELEICYKSGHREGKVTIVG